MTNLRQLNRNNKLEMKELTKYKRDNNLDYNFYGVVNTNVLNKKNDEYEYRNPPSIIDFIQDIFRPIFS